MNFLQSMASPTYEVGVAFKPMEKFAPAIAAAAPYLAAGAMSLMGNIFGAGSTKSTNKTNLKIAQMNNEFNERMFDKQIAYNWDMWNAENEYNTASAQRQRLEEAGLNPYLMMNGGDAGVATGGNSVAPPTAQPVTMEAFQPNFQGLIDAALNYGVQESQIRKTNAEAALVETQAEFEREMLTQRLNQLVHQNDKLIEEGLGVRYDNQFKLDSYDERLRNILINNRVNQSKADLNVSEAKLANAAAALNEENLKWVAPQALARIATETSEQVANYAAGGKYAAEAKESVSRTLQNEETTKGIKFENVGKRVKAACDEAAENLLKMAAEQEGLTKLNESRRSAENSYHDYILNRGTERHGVGATLRYIRRNLPFIGK